MSGPRWAIVAAAGAGSRFGGRKQFASLGGRALVDIAVDLFAGWHGVVVAVPTSAEPVAGAVTVRGGPTRRESVAAALAAVPSDAAVVAVHDAARPLASRALLRELEAVLGWADGVIPGQPVTDTVKRIAPGGAVVETLDREHLRTVQTPQLFRADALRRAHQEVAPDVPAPDDAALLEAAGFSVVVVDWEEDNPKITRPGDLERLSPPG